MVPPCTLPAKLAVSGVISTVLVSWCAGRSMRSVYEVVTVRAKRPEGGILRGHSVPSVLTHGSPWAMLVSRYYPACWWDWRATRSNHDTATGRPGAEFRRRDDRRAD